MTAPEFYYEVYDDTDYQGDENGNVNDNSLNRLLGVWLDVENAVEQAEKDPYDLGMDAADDALSEDLPYVVKVYRRTFGIYGAATQEMVMRKKWDRWQCTDDDGDPIEDDYFWECSSRLLNEKFMIVELP